MKTKYKIAFINGGLSVSETFIYDLIKELGKSHEVMFFTANVPAYTKGIRYKLVDFLLPAGFRKFVNKIVPIKSEQMLSVLEAYACSIKLHKLLLPYDLIYMDYGTTAVMVQRLLSKLGKPYIVHFHGFDITSKLKDPLYRKQLKEVFNGAAYIVAASNYIKRLLILEGAEPSKIQVIRYGLDKGLLDKHKETERSGDSLKLVFAGRLTPKKHPIALIHAFKIVNRHYPDVSLTIIGDGPLKNECVHLAAQLGLQDKVLFNGSLINEEAVKTVANADIYVQHSVTALSGDQEGFGVSIAEAAYLGKPVVSTLHNGIPEHVIDGVTGFLVPEFDYESMAEKIGQLFSNRELLIEMGEAGHKNIDQLCDSAVRAQQVDGLIKTAIDGSK